MAKARSDKQATTKRGGNKATLVALLDQAIAIGAGETGLFIDYWKKKYERTPGDMLHGMMSTLRQAALQKLEDPAKRRMLVNRFLSTTYDGLTIDNSKYAAFEKSGLKRLDPESRQQLRLGVAEARRKSTNGKPTGMPGSPRGVSQAGPIRTPVRDALAASGGRVDRNVKKVLLGGRRGAAPRAPRLSDKPEPLFFGGGGGQPRLKPVTPEQVRADIEAFLTYFRETPSFGDACMHIGRQRGTVEIWLEENPEFEAEVTAIKAAWRERLKSSLYVRCVDGWKRPIYQGGKLVGHEHVYDNSSGVKLLAMEHGSPDHLRPKPQDKDVKAVWGPMYPKLVEIFMHAGGPLVVEHAPGVGAEEAVAQLIARYITRKRNAKLVTTNPARAAYLLSTALSAQGWRSQRTGSKIQANEGFVDVLSYDDPPQTTDAVFLLGVDNTKDGRTVVSSWAGMGTEMLVVAGRPCEATTAAKQLDNVKTVQVRMSDAVAGFWVTEAQREAVKRTAGDSFNATYELESVSQGERVSLLDFFRTRLLVTTTKAITLLDPDQQGAARKTSMGDSTPIVPFIATPLQRRLLSDLHAARARLSEQGLPLRAAILKGRRSGFTTALLGRTYERSATNDRIKSVTLAQNGANTSLVFGIARTFRDNDPKKPRLRDPDSKTSLDFLDTGSLMTISTAGARGFSRGLGLQIVHGTEVAYWEVQLQSMLAGMLGATENGELILESTANGYDQFRDVFVEGMAGTNGFVSLFYPWFEDPFNRMPLGTFNEQEIRDTLDDEEKELIAKHALSMAQIAFRRVKKKEYGPLFPQEMPENTTDCFLSSGVSYFPLAIVSLAINEAASYKYEEQELCPGGNLYTWKEPEKGRRYIAASDTSEGLADGDDNGTVVIDYATGEEVAMLYGRMSMDDQAKWGAWLAKRYNTALWAIERNNTSGGAVIERVKGLGYTNLYAFKETETTRRDGWSTDATTRPLVLDRLRQKFETNRTAIKSSITLQQCASFKLQADGQFRGNTGAKDDAVMMESIAEYVRFSLGAEAPRITIHNPTRHEDKAKAEAEAKAKAEAEAAAKNKETKQ